MNEDNIEVKETAEISDNTSNNDSKKRFNPLVVVGIVLALGILLIPLILNTKKMQKISLEEVAKHTDRSDCWMIIEGNVYDVSNFVPKHPGEDAILFGCGKDATNMFNSRPSDGTSHSDRARVQLENLKIGTLSE